ncbi:MAG: SCP2 sterol-binding domain-containing protein [Gammaproteobacteria bacterium]|nr:SCP2 sterol-binding domain-containing protein [Gammaproteobacteria bacterium]
MAPAWLDKFAAASVEAALTSMLELDPASRAEARALAGKRLALILEPGPLSLTLCFLDTGLDVVPQALDDADACVQLDPAAAARILADGADAVSAGGVTMRGDTALATAVFELLRGLRPDLLAPVGKWFGPESAHVLGESARRAGSGLRSGLRQGLAQTRARLTHPDGLLPDRVEVARFLDEVDDLTLAVDRLEARMQRLQRNLGRQPGEPGQGGPS